MKRIAIAFSFFLSFYSSYSQTGPGIVWSTYYSGQTPGLSEGQDVGVDSKGNVYLLITTSDAGMGYRGADMSKSFGERAMLVKFSSAGRRIWATYFDNYTPDYRGMSMTVDAFDNVYIAGIATVNITTSAIVTKVNSSGVTQWTKSFTSGIYPSDITTDPSGNVLLVGKTTSRTGVASNGHDNLFGTSGAYSSKADGFLIKVSPSGQVLWGTYCGGNEADEVLGLVTDNDGNVYVIGTTESTTDIAFNGFDETYGASWSDGFIIKYSASGAGQWGTYFGGNNEDQGRALAIDKVSNMLYAGGRTLASTGLAHNGYDNTVNYYDAWLAKFTLDGERIWSTYYGGPETVVNSNIIYDACEKLAVDASGNVYMAGITLSQTEIASNGFDNTYNGKFDTFIVKFTEAGARLWGTYFGGAGDDNVNGLTIDGYNLYMTGRAMSPGLSYRAFDQTFAPGNKDSYLLKVTDSPLEERSFISGVAYDDRNNNCRLDAGEPPVAGMVIRTEPVAYFAVTDSAGVYTIAADPGVYDVQEVVSPDQVQTINPTCPAGLSHRVNVAHAGDSISMINFGNQVTPCFRVEVNVSSTQRRRCASSATVVSYRNTAFVDAADVKVFVSLPEYVRLKSADTPFVAEGKGVYSFFIGELKAGTSGRIVIEDSVICGNSSIRNLSQCTKVWATPVSYCSEPKPTWDKADIIITSRCLAGGKVKLVIRNKGDGDMADSAGFRLFLDARPALQGKFKLAVSDSLVMRIYPRGKTIYFQADQTADHPWERGTSLVMEGCANAGEVISTGFGNVFPMYSNEPTMDIECLTIVDSFDPNDKRVMPSGLDANHYVATGTRLQYTVRFQNTGTAPAIDVVIVDTLDANLEISTLRLEGSSHPSQFSVEGKQTPVLTWNFKNIDLPDSTSDEPGSHGFVKFSILPAKGLADKTVISNAADIGFDYNEFLRTNVVTSTIHDTPWAVHEDDGLEIGEVVVLKPDIHSLNVEGDQGKVLRITGANFSKELSENIVIFDGAPVAVLLATPSALVVTRNEPFGGGTVRVTNLAGWDEAGLTVSLPDTPPSKPMKVVLVREGNKVTITWQNNPETDISHYEVLRNNNDDPAGAIVIAKPVEATYGETISNDVTLHYWIRAIDRAANGSTLSDGVTDVAQLKKAQQIVFEDIPSKAHTDGDFELHATATSGLPVSFSSSNPAVATISGANRVTIVGTGTTFITATQDGNEEYSAAGAVSQRLDVKGSQTITFSELPGHGTVGNTLTLNATASSGLPVTFTSSNASVVRISGHVALFTGPGVVTITATQPGDAVYGPALPVAHTITVDLITGTETPPDEGDVSIYPNPVAGSVNVRLTGFDTGHAVEIRIVSAIGVPVHMSSPSGDAVEIEVAGLPAGIYYLGVVQGAKHSWKKFLKR